MTDVNKNAVNAWFDLFKEVIENENIDEADIYNMDETGYLSLTRLNFRIQHEHTSIWKSNC